MNDGVHRRLVLMRMLILVLMLMLILILMRRLGIGLRGRRGGGRGGRGGRRGLAVVVAAGSGEQREDGKDAGQAQEPPHGWVVSHEWSFLLMG